MKKSTSKIVMAALALFMAIGIATGSTFAWFSMNNKVTVTGMTVTTKVSSNLQIAAANAEANYQNTLSQRREGILEPVSTTNGENFFYHSTSEHVLGNGNVDDTTWVAYNETTTLANGDADKAKYDSAFNANYAVEAPITTSNVAYGYIDYTFFLKATSTADDQALKMTECNLLYDGAAVTEKAWRVAVFAQLSAKDESTTGIGTLKSILAPQGATNFESGKAVTSTSARGAVTYGTEVVIIDDIDAGVTQYYKVVVRLWLEGDDTTCNNATFATLTEDYTLSLGFELGTSVTGVSALGTSYGLTQTLSNVTSSVGVSTISNAKAFTAVYTAAANYTLPDTVTVTVGGNALTVGTDYTWTKATGTLVINADKITGAVVITVTGDAA